MRRIMVAGNWKMHGTAEMARSLAGDVLAALPEFPDVDVAVFPPAPYLALLQSLAEGSRLEWGAQTLNPNAEGAYTGEVSGVMLRDLGCRYVLVGHSERRSLFGESDTDVAERFDAASTAGLEPVLCVGETREEREAGRTEEVVERQVDAVLERCGIGRFEQAVLAYEPVWAIGTGLTATPEEAQAVHAFLRSKMARLDGTIGGQIRILYGGSVKASNAADLFAQEDIDGGLVGGASLKAHDFIGICRGASRDG